MMGHTVEGLRAVLDEKIDLKTLLTLDMRLPDDLACSVMKIAPLISFKKMDVELTVEISFWIWTWKMGSYRGLFLLNSSNQHQPWDGGVAGLAKRMRTRVNKGHEENRPSISIVKLISAFHTGCNRRDGIASFCDAGIA
jgi:hypothetical protein